MLKISILIYPLHFQAGNKGFMPFCDEYQSGSVSVEAFASGKISYCASSPGRPFVVSGEDVKEVEDLAEKLIALLPVNEGEVEPMMNVLCWKEQNTYHLAIFPRVKHRPSNYGDGEGQFLFHPLLLTWGKCLQCLWKKILNYLLPPMLRRCSTNCAFRQAVLSD